MTLTEFLLARIAEDEDEANAMLRRYREGADVSSRMWRRLLAECEAKRRIVELHSPGCRDFVINNGQRFEASVCPRCRVWGDPEDMILIPGKPDPSEAIDEPDPCETLRLLALPYADHPDYRDEWLP